ncbi:uncharacterized protein M6B38_272380 [Iris pallida]|uniref:Uncharacterized protein n=1 Tax=Iris pallida TaxID=29817 RepID=A0AAX6I642_IRIPA|nr:uncharacterized protein M6B38_272380 [Iris pallida]
MSKYAAYYGEAPHVDISPIQPTNVIEDTDMINGNMPQEEDGIADESKMEK